LTKICSDREQQAAVLGVATPMPTDLTGKLETVRYVPCPACQRLMHRVNFARCSHVVVDVCKPHGTWFDKDELRRIVEFIRAGGFEKARSMEISELERQRRQLRAARMASPLDTGSTMRIHRNDSWEPAVSAAAFVLKTFLRR
jgi:Zn-finger nucleic acid-binding protein